MRAVVIVSLLIVAAAFVCVACRTQAADRMVSVVSEALEPQTGPTDEGSAMDNFSYAETIPATREDVIAALQGEWASKENGFNYTLKIKGTRMTLGYSDRELGETGYDVRPGMPIRIVPENDEFDQQKGRSYSEMYLILSMYFVNDRITLNVRPKGRGRVLEDELVLSRGMTHDELAKLEDVKPRPNLVFRGDGAGSAESILKALQGSWVGRDNCNYTVTFEGMKVSVRSGAAEVLSTTAHLSDGNPSHVELDSYDLASGNIASDIFGLYYLDDTAIVLSIHSGFMDHKYEYVLRKPEYFGRFTMDKEIIPELEGEWRDLQGNALVIRGNSIEYQGRKDVFHVVTRSFSDVEGGIYHLVSESNGEYMFGGMFMPFEYSGGRLVTRMQILDAPSPEFIFMRTE